MFSDKPGPPTNMKVTDVTERTVGLKWSEPESDGGCEITGYVIEEKEANKRSWQRIGSTEATEKKVNMLYKGVS